MKLFRDKKLIQHNFSEKSICTLAEIIKPFGIPAIITTQCVPRYGPCVPSIKKHLGDNTPEFDKSKFSMMTKEVFDFLKREKRDHVVVVGVEAHICVSQTVFELQKHGYKVVVLADAVSSSSFQERNLALRRMLASGISVNSLEGWTFELLGSSDHPLYDKSESSQCGLLVQSDFCAVETDEEN
ncbi:isochorismatase domain-containing protein 2, mitochondrial precursor, putative [Talaromyces stipitatus ATCC 10500]|uniref:Isochorismatase domain-containing protein 2, mitochondrial, putative n=1 Tax=Talaromyces stipitatus (strain ATCC 10500 / CBS 375.48 / QM 6759 / NRRL 1006) TaxID=441959 RepID=B8M1B4_TALSN|nr:isochorismatase domain-containing protein 2, mitochondrial precursor, putative [Talaromyces stipitatus ATCC 10500]EED21810.1 isochorismatase domain-containing protein 2, mitochondrial precursor, putative [Talaromyces stipitatus ATCC 10500]